MPELSPRIRLYLGTTGSGKTTLFCEHLRTESRVIVFDTMEDEKLEHFGVVVDTVPDLVALVSKSTRSGHFHIRCKFIEPERFDFVCKMAMQIGDMAIYVDELSFFCASQNLPDGLQKVIRLGRHPGVRFSATTQRTPDIPTLVTSQVKEAYIFQMHLPNDIRYLSQFIPDAEKVINFKVGEYLLWKPGPILPGQAPPIIQAAPPLVDPTPTVPPVSDRRPTNLPPNSIVSVPNSDTEPVTES